VKKSPHPQASSYDKRFQRRQLKRELEVYQRLPTPHNRLIRIFGFSEDDDGDSDDRGLVLEYMPNGSLSAFLKSDAKISGAQQLQWSVEAAEAVALLHSYGIIHADIRPENMVLDKTLGLRIIDLSGSSIDGKPPLSLESTRFYLPRSRKDEMPCSVITDLFALGSSIYQIMTRRQPYEDLNDDEVEVRYSRKDFPSIGGIPYGNIIRRCWMCEFDSAQEVLDTLLVAKQQYMEKEELCISISSVDDVPRPT
jgi:serine/threonine protein kinase